MTSLRDRIRQTVSEARLDGEVIDVRRTAQSLAGAPEKEGRVGVIADAVIREGVRQRAALEIPPGRGRRAG